MKWKADINAKVKQLVNNFKICILIIMFIVFYVYSYVYYAYSYVLCLFLCLFLAKETILIYHSWN